MIGVRKNHGTSRAATMNSTSRKRTFSDATSSARPDMRPTKSGGMGSAGHWGGRTAEQSTKKGGGGGVREPLGRAHARQRDEVHDQQQREHHAEAHEVRGDD